MFNQILHTIALFQKGYPFGFHVSMNVGLFFEGELSHKEIDLLESVATKGLQLSKSQYIINEISNFEQKDQINLAIFFGCNQSMIFADYYIVTHAVSELLDSALKKKELWTQLKPFLIK